MFNKMNVGIVALSLVVFASALNVDARNVFVFKRGDGQLMKDSAISRHGSALAESLTSSSAELSLESICQMCLEVSRGVEKLLSDPSLPEKVHLFASDACHLLPKDLEVKCVEMLNSYANQAILFLQTYFSEKVLCNSTGICPADTVSIPDSVRNDQLVLRTWISDVMIERGGVSLIKLPQQESSSEISDSKNCDTCHAIMDELRNGLEDPEFKIKVIKALLNACKNTGNHVNQCKRMVVEYGPMIMSKFKRYLVNNDPCYSVHVCEAPTSFASVTKVD
ncbi:hypothetical protein Scep_013418 [Stephania cephalantha]|uniref:Saposin B-type domain-containing protein n=1 Tax=Stephania cephalantha TaxID=152367 RepID=A0AAP0JJ37_9MAGN